ncbi:MAG: hypothetical protein AAGA96_11055, partial [Verrucomicrobiota bacterium]
MKLLKQFLSGTTALAFGVLLFAGTSHSADWKVKPASDWGDPEVRMLDPAPELNLAFTWTGKTNQRKEGEGYGTLIWRKADSNDILSVYKGEMKAGGRDGFGVWEHRSGSKYQGEWGNNVKHGFGEYWHYSGLYLKGTFENDKMEGQGTWIGADGIEYDGPFKEGKRHGTATLTYPDGTTRISEWADDEEVTTGTADLLPYIQIG